VKRSQVALEHPAFPARLGTGAGRVHRTFAVIATSSRVCTDQIVLPPQVTLDQLERRLRVADRWMATAR
jgi:hypothetical protein